MSEQEMMELKEQIKQELLEEMKKPREKTVWQQIKQEFEKDFKLFNYKKETKVEGVDYQPYMREDEIHFENEVSSAIGTLIKLEYKSRNVNQIKANYEDVKDTVEKILNILKAKAGKENGR